MIAFNQTQLALIEILRDGLCHSGNELGLALGVSRSAIWKQINQLMAMGITIDRLPHQGYRLLNPLILLNQQDIAEQLQKEHIQHPVNIHVLNSVDSTNRYLKELALSTTLEICCAEMQTQGRGRFGRYWHSPFGENIYCSSRWNLQCDLSRLAGLSLVTSLSVLRTINEFTADPNIKIKWPNDILWRDKKLCGSLIEIIAEPHNSTQVIIGIGLNVNTDTTQHTLPDKPWCSLFELSQQRYNRNQIIARLIINLESYINQFLKNDLNIFNDEWNQYDYLSGKHVTVTQSSGTISGIAQGISQSGELIISDTYQKIHYLSSGDASITSYES